MKTVLKTLNETISNTLFYSQVSIIDDVVILKSSILPIKSSVWNTISSKNNYVIVEVYIYFYNNQLQFFKFTEKISRSIWTNQNCIDRIFKKKINIDTIPIDTVIQHPLKFHKYKEVIDIDNDILSNLKIHDTILNNVSFLKSKRIDTIQEISKREKLKCILENIRIVIKHTVYT